MNMRAFFHKYSIFVILFFLVLFLTIASNGAFLTLSNILGIVRQSSIIGIIAFGVTLIIIRTGIDLSSGSLLAFVSVVSASLLQTQKDTGIFIKYPNLPVLPILVPVFVGLALGAAVGCINGTVVVKAKIPPFIITLGMMTIARGAAFIYSNGRPLSALNQNFNTMFGDGFFLLIPNPVWTFAIFAFITHFILSNTHIGSYIYAIGSNSRAAYVSGINTGKYLIFVYTYAGFLVGVASLVLTARIGSGQAGLGMSYELFAIASAVIGGTSFSGGRGTIWGTVMGTIMIGVIKNGMDILNISAYLQQIVLGIVIVAAVIVDQQKYKVRS